MNSLEEVHSWKVVYLTWEKGNKSVHYKLVNAFNVRGAMINAIKILPAGALIVSIMLKINERRYNYDSQSKAFI